MSHISAAPELATSGAAPRHVYGLDSIRAIAAMWVALAHGGAFPVREMWTYPDPIGRVAIGLYDCLFNGVAAVIVFFLISGFCIHYPWVNKPKLDVGRHLIRRYVRVGVPLLVIVAVMQAVSANVAEGARAVLWSVYCELIYYSIYPFLFACFRRFGIGKVLALSTVASAALVVAHFRYLYVIDFSVLVTWLLCMPAWLLGCLIAERVGKRRAYSGSVDRIAWWRAAALVYTSAATVIVFHSPIKVGYPATMLMFAFYAFFWLERELRRFELHRPRRALEWIGTWSYSIYLVHNPVIHAVKEWRIAPALEWMIIVIAIALCSYLFAIMVEFPSHRLARRLAERLRSVSPIINKPTEASITQ